MHVHVQVHADVHMLVFVWLHLPSEVKLWWSKDGKANKIGEPSGVVPAAVIDQCFSRMAGWVKLAICVIKHEYPDYELVSSFGALFLSADDKDCEQTKITPCAERSFGRLAKSFKVDVRDLIDEFRLVKPLAARVHVRESVSSAEAWRRAIAHWCDGRSVHAIDASGVEVCFGCVFVVWGVFGASFWQIWCLQQFGFECV